MISRDCGSARKALEADSRSSPFPDDVARHLDECRDCRLIFDAGRVELDPTVFERLSGDRREAMMAALAAARSNGRRPWLAVAAAAVLAAAVLAAAATLVVASLDLGDRRGARGSIVASALVEDHIRYLRAEDRGTGGDRAATAASLGPYVDFPLRIPHLPESRLTGSRRCYLLERRVALLFYDGRAGPLSYFALEAGDLALPGRRCEAGSALRCASFKGYRVLSWENAGLLHAIVGPDTELVDLAARGARDSLDREIDRLPNLKGDPGP